MAGRFFQFCILLGLGGGAALQASAYIYIRMGNPQVRRSQMALHPPVLNGPQSGRALQAGTFIFQTLTTHFQTGEYFKLTPQKAFLERPGETSFHPYPKDPKGFRWKNWQLLDTDYLVFMGYRMMPEGQIQMDLFLYHIPLRRKIFQKQYLTSRDRIKKLAYTMGNDIVKAITGRPAVFLTKIAAVRSMSGTKKELFVMDFNGQNPGQVSFHHSAVLSPVWSPDGRFIAYTAYLFKKSQGRRNADIILYDRLTKTRRIVSRRAGVNIASDFFPGGGDLLATLFLGRGLRDIVRLSLRDGSFKTLTRGPGGVINVEPTLHPSNREVVFSSDRGGRVMLYSMNTGGRGLKRLTYRGSYNSWPDFSPDGKHIVFSGREGGRFDIFLMKADGTNIQRLTSFKKAGGQWANSEAPSFSPDGRFIVFSSNKTGTYQLYVMNVESLQTRRITHDRHHYKSPSWSPFLQ